MKLNLFFATFFKTIATVFIICFTVSANAQNVAMNTNGAAADASAMLDVSSTTKGFLPPRMTTIQRTGIPSPAEGLMVFDTDTKSYWYFSTAWKEVTNISGFSLPYSGSGSSPVFNLFSITNTSNDQGIAAIYGKRSTGASFSPGVSVGVWGDNSDGAGVFGSSNNHFGVMGTSLNKYGVYGSGAVGVYGFGSGLNTIGVMGSGGGTGTVAIYGDNGGGTFGKAAIFTNSSTTNVDTLAIFEHKGTGFGMYVNMSNQSNSQNAISAVTKGTGAAIYGQADKGVGGYFTKANATNGNPVVQIDHIAANGNGLNVLMNNINNTYPGISIDQLGSGAGLNSSITYASNTKNSIEAVNYGLGGGVNVVLTNANSTGNGIKISNSGTNTSADFAINNASNGSSVLALTSNGQGPGLLINNTNANAVTSLATFKKNGTNKARIDGTGKGYFNGGTQSSGADVAEAFDVTGNRNEYETGDVLIISVDKDRAVEKSSQSYSTLVAGVFATKPGVLLTEENIETDISDKVPMGVVGVIPTKVCVEGGEIKRGDLLVTSSIPGVAMKADIEKVKPGQVIGKALENFNSTSTGKIKVLVNVK